MRPVLPGMRCHIVTRLTSRPRSGREAAQQGLGGREVRHDLGGRALAVQEADRLTGPYGGFIGSRPPRAQPVPPPRPPPPAGGAQRAAAAPPPPRGAAAHVPDPPVDGGGP